MIYSFSAICSGEIPATIGNVVNLKTLNLSDSKLTGLLSRLGIWSLLRVSTVNYMFREMIQLVCVSYYLFYCLMAMRRCDPYELWQTFQVLPAQPLA